jgi:hypothetical protein
MLRKLFAAGALVLADMCMAVPVAYADVGLSLDPDITVDQAAPADFVIAITAPAVDLTAVPVADLPSSGDEDGPMAAFCPAVAPRITHDAIGDPRLRIDDVGWCLG